MIRMAMALLIGVGCGVGVGVACWKGVGSEPVGAGIEVADRAPIAKRLSELETLLALERNERQLLADDLGTLVGLMAAKQVRGIGLEDKSGSDSPERFTAGSINDERSVPLTGSIRLPFPGDLPQTPEALGQIVRQQQFDRFIAAGIAPGQAQAILQREEGIELEVLRARHAAAQSGASPQEVANITPLTLLRRDLGDTDYAKYLAARGRPNSIDVREVMIGSPAEIAGLKSGDEIVAYNGQRVFNANELTALSYEAEPGTSVQLQVVRDGQTIPIYVEAGPIGINGGG